MTRKSVSLLAILAVVGVIALSIVLSRWLATSTTQTPNYAPPPGAINPQVTQANIAETICVSGWTRTVRPPREYTSALKRQEMPSGTCLDALPITNSTTSSPWTLAGLHGISAICGLSRGPKHGSRTARKTP